MTYPQECQHFKDILHLMMSFFFHFLSLLFIILFHISFLSPDTQKDPTRNEVFLFP